MALNPGATSFTPAGAASFIPAGAASFTPVGAATARGTLEMFGNESDGVQRLWRGPVTLVTGPLHLRGSVGRIASFAGPLAIFRPDSLSRPDAKDTAIPIETIVSLPVE